jgi:hypothetical protein
MTRESQAQRWAQIIAEVREIDALIQPAQSLKELQAIAVRFRRFALNGAIGVFYSGTPNYEPYHAGECDREDEAQQLMDQVSVHLTDRRAELVARKAATPGHIYLVECDGHYKIGKSKRPLARLGRFATMWLKPTRVIAAAQFDDMSAKEAELHRSYAGKRVHGEWFALDAADVEAIKAVLS